MAPQQLKVLLMEGNWTDYMEDYFGETGQGKGKEKEEVTTNKAEKSSEKVSQMVK